MLEELGSDSHVIFPIDAPRVEAEELRAAADHEDEALLADDRAVWNARVSSKTEAAPGRTHPPRRRSVAALLLRPGQRREPDRPGRAAAAVA